jgi:hypothetical protein
VCEVTTELGTFGVAVISETWQLDGAGHQLQREEVPMSRALTMHWSALADPAEKALSRIPSRWIMLCQGGRILRQNERDGPEVRALR